MALDTTAVAREAIAKIYIAAFNRVPDEGGLSNWLAQYEGGVMTYDDIANTFTASEEYIATYPTILTNEELVTKLYTNVFGRTPDEGGKANWVAQLDNPEISGINSTNILDKMLDTVNADTTNGDGLRLANQASFAVQSILDSVPTTVATAQLSNITSDAATVTAATTAVASSAGVTGSTYALTTSADNITGTENNDVITGVSAATATAATDTLTATDTIDGGLGTDTLKVTTTAANTNILHGADVTNVEILDVRNTGGADTFDASTVAGLTKVIANQGVGSLVASKLATGAEMTVQGNGTVANGEVAFAYATATDAVTLNIVDGTNMTAAITAKASTGGTSDQTATTETITSTGAANTVGTVDLANASLTTVTINATTNLKGDILSNATDQVGTDGAVTISGAATVVELTAALDNTIKTMDASGLTAGGVKATIGTGTEDYKGGAGVDTITLNTGLKTATFGAGDDVVTTAAVAATAASSIDAGEGSDTLVIANTTHVDTTAERAVYTGFETINNATSSAVAANGFTGATSLISSADQAGFTSMNATQAAAITNTADQASGTTYALTTATGTSDVLSITAKNATATASADLAALTVNGFETMNVAVDSGNVLGTHANATVVAFTAATDLTALNISGAYGAEINLANTAKAITVANTLTGTASLEIKGAVVKGSSITGTANADTIATGTAAVAGVAGEFVTYNAAAGDDAIATTLTALNNANNSLASIKIDGGAGTDTVTFAAADATFVDSAFQYITNVEKLTLANTTATTITTGGFFDTNFKAQGVTLTTGSIADNAATSIDLSSFTGAATIVATTADTGDAAGTKTVVKSGSGDDTVTLNAASWVGVDSAAGNLIVETGAGADTISLDIGTIANAVDASSVVVNGGTGADKITVDAVNGDATDAAAVYFAVAAGDSTAAARDTITGFDLGTAALISSVLDFDGGTVQGNTAGTNGTDSGTIKSHAITSGIVTFDDADTFATAVTVNTSNLTDVLAYLDTNITTTNASVAFAYDSDNDGSNDATIVFNANSTDSVVELTGVVATSVVVDSSNAATAGLLAIS